jgi:hypothetical protein
MRETLVIAGAGCSRGALGPNSPTAAEFGAALLRVEPAWTSKYTGLAQCVEELSEMLPGTSPGAWGLDKVWGAVDNRAKLYRATGKPDFQVSKDLHAVICEVFGRRLDSDIAKVVAGAQSNLRSIISGLQQPVWYVSFNYDLLIDELAQSLDGAVIKPHGSVDWSRSVPDYGRPPVHCSRAMEPRDVMEPHMGGPGVHPAIVGPVPFKSELAIEVQLAGNCLGFHQELTYQWRQMVDHLALCSELVVIGYGFPPEDVHAVHLFREAALRRRRRKAPRLKLTVHERDEQRFKETIEHIQEVFWDDEVAWPSSNAEPINDGAPAP